MCRVSSRERVRDGTDTNDLAWHAVSTSRRMLDPPVSHSPRLSLFHHRSHRSPRRPCPGTATILRVDRRSLHAVPWKDHTHTWRVAWVRGCGPAKAVPLKTMDGQCMFQVGLEDRDGMLQACLSGSQTWPSGNRGPAWEAPYFPTAALGLAWGPSSSLLVAAGTRLINARDCRLITMRRSALTGD